MIRSLDFTYYSLKTVYQFIWIGKFIRIYFIIFDYIMYYPIYVSN